MDAALLEAAIRRRVPSIGDELRPLLDATLAAVAARWPEAPSEPADLEGYATHVAERLARQPDPSAALARLHAEDLFLAWWAGTGAASGIAAFEATYGGELGRIAARFAAAGPSDELVQQLRVKLFVRPSNKAEAAPSKIHDYSGFGALLAWLRVVAVRGFVDATRATRSERYHQDLDEAELLGLPGSSDASAPSPALVAAIKRAFAAAVAGLAPRQRALLRHAYVDRLTLEQIAASYSIHRATVARVLASAREQLVEHTRRDVVANLGVAPSELASALGTLERRLDLSLSRVLQAP